MKVLVIGSGGREHAVILKLLENPKIEKIYCAPGNGGISKSAQCVSINPCDIERMRKFAVENGIDFAVVTPDDPLVAGMADALSDAGIKTFGPSKAAAAIEGSKVFAKELMKKYSIPTAKYEVFDSCDKAVEYIKSQNTYPTVIKADGLALGKGVIIAENEEQALEAVASIMKDKIFGESGNRIVVEEFLTGPEVSVLAFTDGKTIRPMVSSMDHKRVYDEDKGPNTGGMGTVAPNPYYTDEVAKRCMDEIFLKTINAMASEGRPFKGCLYFGLMMTENGPKVIEFNCRFGDPETQVVLPLLKTDLLDIMEAVCDERLDELEIEWSNENCACVVMASGGYPKKYPTGLAITGLDEMGQVEGVTVYHAGTRLDEDGFKTSGGRVLGVSACGENLQTALKKAYNAVEKISFESAHYRRDIGQRALKALKM